MVENQSHFSTLRAKRATFTVGEISFHYDLQKYKKNRFCGNDRVQSIFFSTEWRERETRLKRLLVYDRDMYSSKTKEKFARLARFVNAAQHF